MLSRMSKSSAPNSLRRFFDRVVHRSFGYIRPDLPFFRRLVTEW